MTNRLRLLAATIFVPATFGFGSLAFAQARAPTTSETIIVTATRTPQPAAKVGASVTVLTNQAILRAQSVPVVDLLRDVPGLGFSRNGGIGGVTSVRLRGAEADQTVVLIDGVKINDPSSPGGGYNFANLLVGDIDRIEVLRGPQSTLYGSQAMGGVVQIFTRRGDVPFAGSLTLEGGDLASYHGRVSVRGTFEGLSYAANIGHFETKGISAAASGSERDNFQSDQANGRLSHQLTPSLELEGRAFWTKSDVGNDGFPAPLFVLADTPERAKTEEWVVYAGANLNLLDGRSRTRLGLSQSQIERESLNFTLSPATTFIGKGTNQTLELQSTFDITPQFQLVGGGELEEARLRTASPSSTNPNPIPLRASSELGALYIQAQASPTPWLTTSFGARWTHNDRFGDALNARATLVASFNDGNTLVRAGAANGFKAPTPFQLFSNFGNPTLEPEEAGSAEFGVEQALFSRRLIGAITFFDRDTTNQIDFISCFRNPIDICVGRPSGTYDNIARAKAEGLEASLEAKPTDRLSLSIGYSTLNARNKAQASANFNRRLARRPEETSFVTIGYDFPFGLDVSATVSRIGDSFDDAANSRRLKGYELLTLRASQKLGDHWSIFGRIENAGDEIYQTTTGYGSPRQQSWIGLRASF
jgi:vitamin B12 transporter